MAPEFLGPFLKHADNLSVIFLAFCEVSATSQVGRAVGEAQWMPASLVSRQTHVLKELDSRKFIPFLNVVPPFP